MLINESRTACKYTPGRQGTPIRAIAIHHWGIDGQTHEGVVDWFCNPAKGAQTSAHFVVSAGKVHCLVSPTDTAWHAGTWPGNLESIGIELRPEASDADYKTAAELVKWLRAKYGDLPLKPHKAYTATACPGRWDLTRLDREARGGSTVATQSVKYYRPVPSFIPVSQEYGSNATATLPSSHWLIKTFGNYQPNGHTGRDYACAEGTDVYAVTDGVVLWADWATKLPGDESHAGYVSRWYMSKSFAGICVVIDHGGFLSVSAHLSRTDLNIGDRVAVGQRIAASGNTGGSTGPHLHWEAIAKPYNWSNGMYGRVNPDRYLANVTTLAPGYTGGTTSPNTPSGDEIDMATLAELRTIVAEETKKAVIRELTYKRDKLGGAGGKVSLQDEILYIAANEAKVNRKLDALVDGVNAILDKPGNDFELDPEKAYAEIGRSVVAALKGTQA